MKKLKKKKWNEMKWNEKKWKKKGKKRKRKKKRNWNEASRTDKITIMTRQKNNNSNCTEEGPNNLASAFLIATKISWIWSMGKSNSVRPLVVVFTSRPWSIKRERRLQNMYQRTACSTFFRLCFLSVGSTMNSWVVKEKKIWQKKEKRK